MIIGLVLASYLIGAIPFALLIARTQGVDIRHVGSGNVGATNVFRSVGKGWGILTFVADVAKGWLPAALPGWLAAEALPINAGLLCGCAAIIGHNWPVYLRFKGGKGVATSAGVLLGVAPLAVLIGLIAWVVTFALGRYVSVASICAATAIPVAGWVLYGAENPVLATVLTGLGGLVIVRHRTNIQRIRAGTEHRFNRAHRKPTENETP